jgi:hypothetical protein
MGLDYNVKFKDIEKLTEGNWVKWVRDVRFSFMEAGLSGYINGSIEEPSESKKLVEWKQYNLCIIGTLGRIVNNSLAQELSADMSAVQTWLLLKKRTCQDGIVAKMNTMSSHPRSQPMLPSARFATSLLLSSKGVTLREKTGQLYSC